MVDEGFKGFKTKWWQIGVTWTSDLSLDIVVDLLCAFENPSPAGLSLLLCKVGSKPAVLVGSLQFCDFRMILEPERGSVSLALILLGLGLDRLTDLDLSPSSPFSIQ